MPCPQRRAILATEPGFGDNILVIPATPEFITAELDRISSQEGLNAQKFLPTSKGRSGRIRRALRKQPWVVWIATSGRTAMILGGDRLREARGVTPGTPRSSRGNF